MHMEVLLFPSPFQQHPQLLPLPRVTPPVCPQLLEVPELATGVALLPQGVPCLVVPSICPGTGKS